MQWPKVGKIIIMEPRYAIFLCTVGGGLLAAPVGALFGGLTSHLTRRDGRAAGSIIGRSVADAFARGDRSSLSPAHKTILAGAADGAFFLALLGGALGLWIGIQGNFEPRLLLTVAAAIVLLPLSAAVFGLMAYMLSSTGVRGIGLVGGVSILGALIGYQLARADGILLGIVAGSAIASLLGLVSRCSGERPGVRG